MSRNQDTEVGDAGAAIAESKKESMPNTPRAIESAIDVFVHAAGARKRIATQDQVKVLLSEQDPSSWVIMQKFLTTKESWETVMLGIQQKNPDILKDAQGFIKFLEELNTTSVDKPAMRHIKDLLAHVSTD